MGILVFIKDYLIWHYSQAFREGIVIWKNFIWFIGQFFSLGLLFRTLLQPWRKLKEYYGRGFDPQQYLETLFINLIMRFVGFCVRVIVISIGIAAEAMVIILGIAAIILWFAMPLFIILCLSRGVMIFF